MNFKQGDIVKHINDKVHLIIMVTGNGFAASSFGGIVLISDNVQVPPGKSSLSFTANQYELVHAKLRLELL